MAKPQVGPNPHTNEGDNTNHMVMVVSGGKRKMVHQTDPRAKGAKQAS